MARSSLPIKPFYLPRSFWGQLVTLPSQILFMILGAMGLAHYSRQIVRVRSKRSAALEITKKVGERREVARTTTVDKWVQDNVPSLDGSFTPAWWLPNGHLQTAYIVVGNFSGVDRVDYVRTMLRVPDGGTIAMDMSPPDHHTLPADAPTIVVCHGLTGNSRESYVRNVLAWATKSKADGGLGARGVVVNFRGCGGTPVTSPQLYSAAASCDLHTAAHYLRHTFPQSALHGIGFSLGASVLARYLGERGDSSLLSSGSVIGAPWDIVNLSHALEDGWLSSRLYSSALGKNLIKLFFKHYEQNPAIWEQDDSPVKGTIGALRKLQKMGNGVRLKMVDDVMVTLIGGPQPPWPFASADDYYAYAGSHQLVHNIRVPTLGINAFDDPVVHGDALPISQVEDGSHVHLAVTGGGGHLGWFDGPFVGPRSRDRWVRKPIAEFLTAAARDLAPRGEIEVEVGAAPDKILNEVRGSGLKGQDGIGGWASEVAGVDVGVDWTWVLAEPSVPQTGAKPVRVGWKVLCTDVDLDKHLVSGPSVQGL